ncbi:MAG: hypothetical protein ACRDL5_04660, partial [Solirubrobacteraceae bacterium]
MCSTTLGRAPVTIPHLSIDGSTADEHSLGCGDSIEGIEAQNSDLTVDDTEVVHIHIHIHI